MLFISEHLTGPKSYPLCVCSRLYSLSCVGSATMHLNPSPHAHTPRHPHAYPQPSTDGTTHVHTRTHARTHTHTHKPGYMLSLHWLVGEESWHIVLRLQTCRLARFGLCPPETGCNRVLKLTYRWFECACLCVCVCACACVCMRMCMRMCMYALVRVCVHVQFSCCQWPNQNWCVG